MFSQVPYNPPKTTRSLSSVSTARSNESKSKLSTTPKKSTENQQSTSQNSTANFYVPLYILPPILSKKLDKSILLEKLGAVVQELQLSSACRSTCQSHALTYSNTNVKRLCRLLDFILSHGLKRSSDSYWPLVKEFSSKGQIEFLFQLWKPKSNRSRALSWLYQCLNDALLEFQLQNFARNIAVIHRFYVKSAYVCETEMLETMAIFLRGLESVTFRLFSADQGSHGDFTNDPVTVMVDCPEHQRAMVTSSNTSTISNTNNLVSVVKVSPSRKMARRRGMSTSSFDAGSVLEHSFETSVADFSECPQVLGLTPELQDRQLLDTETCVEATAYNFPPLNLGSIRASNAFVRKKSKILSPRPSLHPSNSPIVRTIVDERETTNDHEQIASMDNSFDVYSQQDRKLLDRNRKTSQLDIDPDTMLKEILSRPRIIFPTNDTSSPPMSSTPIVVSSGTITSLIPSSIPAIRYESDGFKESMNGDEGNRNDSASSINDPIVLKHDKFKIDLNRSIDDGRSEFQSLSLPSHSNPVPMPVPRKGNEAPPAASDFEKQIWKRYRMVSELMATYSDSMSEHSTENGYTTKRENQMNQSTIIMNGQEKGHVDYGELLLESGEIVNLAVHIFTKDGEQFVKIYRVYVNHHFGNGSIRHLLLTNYAVYVLMRPATLEEKKKEISNVSDSVSKYQVDVVVPYSVIDYVSVGTNGQLFNIFTLERKEAAAIICTCNEELTNSILSKLEFHLRRFSSSWNEDKSSSSVPANERISTMGVVTDATPQKIALKKWLCGELGKDDVHVSRYSLIYWNANAVKCDHETSSRDEMNAGQYRSGYLYAREYHPSGWLWKSSEWKQSYFMLRGKKLYQFEDSSCKVGVRVYDLKDEISDCRQIQTKEYAYCMEMSFVDDENKKVHLACQTKHELQQWLYAFVASFSQMDAGDVQCECVSCSIVVAAKYLVLGQESSNLGFIRTLAIVRLDDVVSCQWCSDHIALIMEFSSETEYNHQRWLLSFSCETEMKAFMKAVDSNEPDFQFSQLSGLCSNDTVVCAESCRHWSDTKNVD